MLSRTNRYIVGVILVILVLVQPVILATMPAGTDAGTVSLIVKKGTTLGTIATHLKEEHLIRSKYLFLICSLLLYKGRAVAGEYELSKDMSMLQIAKKMAEGHRKLYTLKIVEGYNLWTVGEAIQKAGIMDTPSFLRLATKHEFLKTLAIPGDSLEGYLAPDTYFFSRETEVDEFLVKIVQRTFKFFEKEDIKKRMEELHMNVFQVLCLASIIEKEARLEEEKPVISAVFHNRLRREMTLDADPTVIYGLAAFNRDLKKSDLTADTPYNTYRLKGLPKGPICNPSRTSIMAALYPNGNDLLYFVSRNDGSHVFSKTMEEHNRFVMRYQRHKNRKP